MLIKASDMLVLGGLDEETALFYDEKSKTAYAGKSTKSVDPKKIGLTGVQIIALYGLVRFLNGTTIFSGIMPLLVGLVSAYASSWWFVNSVFQWDYEVEVHEMSEEELLAFMENQVKKHNPIYYAILFFSVTLIVSTGLFLATDRFLWLFTAVGMAWCNFTTILFFGKIIYKFRKFYKRVRKGYWPL